MICFNIHDMKIERREQLKRIEKLLQRFRVVALLGARQVGKSTLARDFVDSQDRAVTFFDLEDERDLSRLHEPTLTLEPLRGVVVLDEVQNLPQIFRVLRVLADRPRTPARFLVLGSASPDLLRQSSETLAGRIVYHQLPGLTLDEIGADNLNRLWFRGGFPESYLQRTHEDSEHWRRTFIRTFLERDLPNLGVRISARTLSRFWTMLAHGHGGLLNASELGASFGVSHTTVRNYVDLLESLFVVRQLRPWFENVGKREVKSPKIYIEDSGLLHTLLKIPTPHDLEAHPKLGMSWEGFMMQQVIQRLGTNPDDCYFWATHAGAELDLLIVRGKRKLGFEFKRTDAPRVTPSMRSALDTLKLSSIFVIHAGQQSYQLDKKVRAVAAGEILRELGR
jgi:predicted AAA+ superfamily ATPase